MYKRLLLKISGEALTSKDKKLAIDPKIVDGLVDQIKTIMSRGIQIGIVVGGGNFWRGAAAEKNGMPRTKADYIGMLATVMNALSIQSAFENKQISAHVQSSLAMDPKVSELYVSENAIKYLNSGSVVIFAGGTGRPYFTTDTTATLIASEINADCILMAKNGVNGIYDDDPRTNPQAHRYDQISYEDIIAKRLKVMDTTAAAMASDNNVELIVFNINETNSLIRAVDGDIEMTKVVK